MIYVTNQQLSSHAKHRPPEYLQELEACVVSRDSGGLVLDENRPAWAEMVRKYRPDPPSVQPVPLPQWPLLIKMVADFKQPGDIGVGDTLERLLRDMGGAQFKLAMKAAGIPCGCDNRQAWMNARFPYPRKNGAV
jgi:hypothetical protein